MIPSNETLVKRFNEAKAATENWRTTFDVVYSYVRPNTNPIDAKERAKGIIKNTHVFDTTAISATITFVSKIHGNLTPPFGRWAQLESGTKIPDVARNYINSQLELASQTLFQYINGSNFDMAINEFYYDLAIGTGVLTVEEGDDKNPLIFNAISPSDVYIEHSNATTEVENVWREINDITLEEVYRLWPHAIFTYEMTEAEKNNDPKLWSFIFGTIYDCDEKKYTIVVLEKNSKEKILEYDTPLSPWIVARWSKNSNEVLGRGPVLDAWPAISDLNQLMKDMLLASEYAVLPPVMVFGDGVFNPYNFVPGPGARIPISRNSASQVPIQKLDIIGEVQVSDATIQDLRTQINTLLFAGPLRPTTAPPQTATEISIRQQALLELIGPAFGRLERELLSPLINRCLYILRKKGFIPPIEINNTEVSLRYKSTLAQASQLDQVQAFQNMNSILQNTVGAQQALMAYRLPLLPQWLSDRMGVDNSIIKSPDEVANDIAQGMAASTPPTNQINSQTGSQGAPQMMNSKNQPLSQAA